MARMTIDAEEFFAQGEVAKGLEMLHVSDN